jgi:hypothetical protein
MAEGALDRNRGQGTDRRRSTDRDTTHDHAERGVGSQWLRWFLLRGDRLVFTGVISLCVFVISYALIRANLLEIGGSSTMSSLLDGAIAGLLTVITVALSINQLVLSRMFGSPDELRDRLAGATDFRRTVERAADEPTSRVEPIEFFAMIADTLRARSARLSDTATDADGDLRGVLEERSVELGEYADRIDATLEASGMRMTNVISGLSADEYARSLAATHRLQNGYADRLPDRTRAELDTIIDLLEALAISRQYFKTATVQQELARLSRYIVYVGVSAIVFGFLLILVYTTESRTMVGPQYLPVLVSFGIALMTAPITVLSSYMLRIATIAEYAVSVGPFLPPGK